jgi:hypothetical protein
MTPGKNVIAGVNDATDKLFAGVNDTVDKLFISVNETTDKFSRKLTVLTAEICSFFKSRQIGDFSGRRWCHWNCHEKLHP